MSMHRLALQLLLVVACTSTPPPEPKPEPKRAEPSTTNPEPEPKVHACTADNDCMSSCRHGAVSRAWHTNAYPGGEACEDGCTSKGTEAPRCESSKCVAYREGARDPVCTGVDVEPIAGHGPAHRCSADDQCTTTCEHGAVNKEWLSWQPTSECGGGCTNPGHEPPKCEAGRCVAYRDGKPQPSCTERPIAR
jgi:hypothetical protein